MDEPSPVSLPPLKGEVSATRGDRGCQDWALIQARVWYISAWSLVPSWLLSVSFSTESGVWVCIWVEILTEVPCQCQDNIDSFI